MADYTIPEAYTRSGLGGMSLGELINTARGVQEMQGKQAVGDIFQRNVDPQTGQLNIPQAMKDISSSPAARFIAPEAMGEAFTRGTQQFQMSKPMVDDYLSMSGALMNKAGGPSAKDIYQLAAVAAAKGMGNVAENLRTGVIAAGNDPRKLRDVLYNNSLMVQGAGTTSESQEVLGAGGQRYSVPGGVAQGIRAGVPSGVGGVGGQRPGQAGVWAAPPPGFDASLKDMQDDLRGTGNFANELFPLQQAHQIFKNNPDLQTGPGTEARQSLEEFLYAINPQLAKTIGVEPDKIKDYSELRKYLVNSARALAGTTGFSAGTDYSLATTISGTPNMSINRLSNKDLIEANIALVRANRALSLEASHMGTSAISYDKSGNPITYSANKALKAADLDVNAFRWDMMTDAQKQALAKKMPPNSAARARFNRSLDIAMRTGVMGAPNAGQ